jgi:hypothetical protein
VAEGVAIAREIMSAVRPLVQGVQISVGPGAIQTAFDVM